MGSGVNMDADGPDYDIPFSIGDLSFSEQEANKPISIIPAINNLLILLFFFLLIIICIKHSIPIPQVHSPCLVSTYQVPLLFHISHLSASASQAAKPERYIVSFHFF